MRDFFENILDYFRETDLFLWCMSLFCTGYGIVVLYAVSISYNKGGLKVHIAAAVVGVIGVLILSKIDYMKFCEYWYLHAAFTYSLVFLLFFFGVGVADSDNVNWLKIPGLGITIQPSEFLKLSFILTFARHIARTGEDLNEPLNLILLGIHALIPVFLIHKLGDDGSALIFVFIAVAMMIGAGLKWYYILGGGALAVLAFAMMWKFDFLGAYQKERFLVVFQEGYVNEAISWQQDRSLLMMGSGGMFGDGLFNVKHMYIPVVQNDFVIAFIGQALGFIGTISVIALLLTVLLRILSNATKSVFSEGRAICMGVFGMMASQMIINIGMCTKTLPSIGVTLPFFSQGGTSILTTLAGIGLVISTVMHNHQPVYKFKRR